MTHRKTELPEPLKRVAKKLMSVPFIVFAGTGVTSLAKWQELMKALYDKIPSNNWTRSFLDFKPDEYPDLAQKVYDYLGDDLEYHDVIRKKLTPEKWSYTPTQTNILQVTDWIVTTNFDASFLCAYDDLMRFKEAANPTPVYEMRFPEFDHESQFNNGHRKSIVYLHGKIDKNFIMLKRQDYAKFYGSVQSDAALSGGANTKRSKSIEDYLKYLYRRKYAIVFVGFSFADKDFLKTIKLIHEDLRSDDEANSVAPGYGPQLNRIVHYALLSIEYLKENRDVESQLSSTNIEILRYSGHPTCQNFFAYIDTLRQKDKQKDKREIGKGEYSW